jgi:ornithine cyclodeaminase
MVRILSKQDVAQLLNMQDALAYVEEAYKQLVLGNALVPQRIAITDPAPGLTLVMPGIIGGEMNALATKIVSVYKKNPEKYKMPTVLAKIMVQDINTGDIVGIMDGSLITAMRTGAATGVLGIYSAGVQAKKQVSGVYWGLNEKLEKCIVYDLNRATAEEFKKELEHDLSIEIIIANSGNEILKQSDIIVAATTSTVPLFSGNDIEPGVHISSIGAHAPDARELDSKTIQRASLLTAGLKEACLAEAGDYIIPINEGLIKKEDIISIGDIILGNKKGRTSDKEITVFKSVGISAQDVAVAKLVYDRALSEKIGQDIEF